MKKLEKYFEQQQELTHKNLKVAQAVCSEKVLHELRVSIKRIKALWIFLAKLVPEEAQTLKKYFKNYKNIFKLAGMVRDAQIKDKLLIAYSQKGNLPAPLAYQTHLYTKQKEAFKIFKHYAKDWCLDEKVGKQLKKIWYKIDTQNLYANTERLLRQSFSDVRLLLQKAENDEPFHEARKIIKSIYYILHLVFKPDSPQQYQDLKNLEETIGNWHDIAVLIDDLKAYQQASSTPRTHEINTLLGLLAAEKQALQQKIPNLVKEELRCWKIFGKIKLPA